MKYSSLFIASLTLSSLLLASGCISQKEQMIKKGYPLAYADGFDDGCHSGKKAGGNMFEQFKKDVNRFSNHNIYTHGWSDGFRQCESEQESIQRQIRMGMEQQRLTQEKKHYKWEEQRHLESQYFEGVDTSNLKNLK